MENKNVVERRIYNGWAFSENERKKCEINKEIYEELKKKYKILQVQSRDWSTDTKPTEEELNNYDIVYSRKSCYAHGEYTLYKAPKDITTNQLLLIFDGGNLCFGGSHMLGNLYRVSED